MAWTYNPDGVAPRDVVRLLVADTNSAAPIWEDGEVDRSLYVTGTPGFYSSGQGAYSGVRRTLPVVYSPYRAAAMLLRSLAANKGRLGAVIKLLDVQLESGTDKAARSLMDQAAAYIEMDDQAGQFAIATMVCSQYQQREAWWKSLMRRAG